MTDSPDRDDVLKGAPATEDVEPSDVLVLGIGMGSLGFLLASLGSCLILLARDLSVPRSEISWLSWGFGASLLLLGGIGERLLRAGGRQVLQASSAAMASGAAMLGLATSVHVAQAGALLLGVGGAGVILTSPVLVSGPGAAARLTRANAASSMAGIAAPLLMGAAEAVSAHGRLALLVAVPPLLWVALRAFAGPMAPPSTPRIERSAAIHGWAAARSWLGMFAAVSPEFAFLIWGAARLEDSGLGASAASAAAAAFPIGMAAGRVLSPRLIGRAPVVGAGVALAVAGSLLAAAPVGPVLATTALLLAGLGIAPLYPVLYHQLVRTPGLGLARGAALGLLASGVAVLAAPALLDALARVVSLRTGYLAAVPLLLLVLLVHRRDGATERAVAR